MRNICSDIKTLNALAAIFKNKGDNLRHERILAIRQCYDFYTDAQMSYLIKHYVVKAATDKPLPDYLEESLRPIIEDPTQLEEES